MSASYSVTSHRTRPDANEQQRLAELLASAVGPFAQARKADLRKEERRAWRAWRRHHRNYESDVFRLIESAQAARFEFREIVHDANGYEFRARSTRRESTLRTFVVEGSGRDTVRIVVHFGHRSDFLASTNFDLDAMYPGIVPQAVLPVPGSDQVLSLRRLVHSTLADELDKLDRETPSHAGLERRIAVLRQVLEGLETLHRADRLHGDLRPENITISRDGAAALADYEFAAPLDRFTKEQTAYLAPEATRSSPRQASDIYAFGILAERLLGNYRWDSRELPVTLNTEAFEWVLDFCTLENPADRPTVFELQSLLFDKDHQALADRAQKNIRSARAKAVRSLLAWRGDESGDATYLDEAVSGAAHQLEGFQAKYPETALALRSPQRTARLLARIAIDSSLRRSHNQNTETAKARRGNTSIPEFAEPTNPNIDLALRDRLHRLHFDTGIPLDHDAAMPRIFPWGKLAQAKREYNEHVVRVEEARMTLLSMDHYLYTAGVSELLDGPAGRPTDADIATLRRWRHLLAIPDHGRWLYPSFQFGPDDSCVPPLVQVANERFGDANPWEVVSWWLMPRPSLKGKSLASVLHTPEGSTTILHALDRDARQ